MEVESPTVTANGKAERADDKLGSQLFRPYRAIGLVTNGIPFDLQSHGTASFVAVCTGKAFQIFNTEKLALVIVGPQHERKIRAIVTNRELTFTASGPNIYKWRRAKLVRAAITAWLHSLY